MQKLTRIIALSAAVALMGGCVYKRDIPQGNLVNQTMVSQLQIGMSQQQVVSIMGRPLLEAPFDAREWDYVFQLDKAYGDIETRRATLTFDRQGRLADIQTEGELDSALPLEGDAELGPASEGSDDFEAQPLNLGVDTPEQ